MSMIVNVTPDVRLNVESGESCIERRLITQSGKNAGVERWVNVGSYANLDQAAEMLIKRHYALLANRPEVERSLITLIAELRVLGAAMAKVIRVGVGAVEQEQAKEKGT